MKAQILKGPSPVEEDPLELVEIPEPVPGPGEVLIRVNACGVCHTDLHTVEGELDLPKLPIVPGHQVVGVVEGLGEGVTEFEEGDRVGVAWLFSTCGECEFCTEGLENLCEQARFTGQHACGGYAEYMTVPASYAYALPQGFSDLEAAPLLCAGVIGYRALKLSGIKPGQRLGLYGFGASAHVAIQVARFWGCEVYVFTRSKEHQEHARQLGAVWTGTIDDHVPDKMDACITFAPAGWMIPEALRVLKRGGTLAVNAIYMSPIPEMPYVPLYHERTVKSVANATRLDAVEFLELAPTVPVKTDVEIFKLEEANEALKKVKRSEVKGAAVLRVN